MTELLDEICLAVVAFGTLPLWVSLAQFLLIGVHGWHNHLGACGNDCPRVAFVIPAWNEAASLPATIEALMGLDYPFRRWRIYVIDDASTDHTSEVLESYIEKYPGYVRHVRRERGGQGKAHTLNHGIRIILDEDWAEAVMIMDADVLFEPLTLRRMTRHLSDPAVGAVTAYIKEGSQPSNILTRFVAFEYITAQAAARRTQNVLGALACMAGGAQLHSRANLERLGGKIDTSSLAEDTFTTIQTQLAGYLTIFDGAATVWAEEPRRLEALWKQRLRWGRGNVQLTWAFRQLWFRPWRKGKLSGLMFGLQWFSVLLIPLFIALSSGGIAGLLVLKSDRAFLALALLWGSTIGIYIFQTTFSLIIDPATARRAWLEGVLFPGLVSLVIMSFVVANTLAIALGAGPELQIFRHKAFAWIACAWPVLSMISAWLLYRIERIGLPSWLSYALLVIVGYGPLMSAITVAAFAAELSGKEIRWDKTIKMGRVRMIDDHRTQI